MSKLTTYDPFAQLTALQQQFFGDEWMSPIKGVTIPTTDVYTDNNTLVVEAHLPNFSDDDVNISVDSGVLTIQAQMHEREEDKQKKYVIRESSSSFFRQIQLPERADTEKIEAHLDNGILKVHIPLTPLPEPKKITIQAKSSKK